MKEAQPLCCLRGTVAHGKGKGHQVGMPTANLDLFPGQSLPPAGVYATRVCLGEETYLGVTNVGTRPSVDDDSKVTVETLILNFSGDLYGREMALEFWLFLRPVRRFSSLGEVRDQVERDAAAAEAYFRRKEERQSPAAAREATR